MSKCRRVTLVFGCVSTNWLSFSEMIGLLINSGSHFSTGSSRSTRPRSTHWRAAMDVKSLVQEAIQYVLSLVTGGAVGESPL